MKIVKKKQAINKIQEALEYEVDEKVIEVMNILKNENFGSEEQRKLFVDLLTSLHNSKDKMARRIFKLLGDYCSNAIKDLYDKFGVSSNSEELQEQEYVMVNRKKYKKYKFNEDS